MEKGKEKDLVDSEEARGGRRRSRRFTKTKTKRRLKTTSL